MSFDVLKYLRIISYYRVGRYVDRRLGIFFLFINMDHTIEVSDVWC